MSLFYDHLVRIEEVHTQVEALDVEDVEKIEIINTIEDTLHHRVVHTVLDNLDDSHHNYFLELLKQKPHHQSILDFLKSKIIGIEDKITEVAEEVKYDTLKTIRQFAHAGQ